MADLPISQWPGQPSRHVTHMPEIGAGSTRFLVFVAELRLGVLNDIKSSVNYLDW
jgi:hypothetical protein